MSTAPIAQGPVDVNVSPTPPREVIDELEQRCAFYERTNAEQASILNRVIAERDDYRAALVELRNCTTFEWISFEDGSKIDLMLKRTDAALAKHSPEDEIERARRMV